MNYPYPRFQIDLPEKLMEECFYSTAPRLLHEVGLRVPNERFLEKLKNRKGLKSANSRVCFDSDLVCSHIDEIRENLEHKLDKASESVDKEWHVSADGYSMMTIDIESEKLREGTRDDLRNMIKLAESFNVGGNYMIMPQDVPPAMQVLDCFKICWEMSEKIKPYDYQLREQIPFLYEMHQVMNKPMDIRLTIPSAMELDPKDLDIFLDMYPLWKKNHRNINFRIGNYPMTGILKPITATGCATMMFCETLATRILLKSFDPELELNVSMAGGMPTDMRNACWAFGSPRGHLFDYLTWLIPHNFCGKRAGRYIPKFARLETSSPTVDVLAGMEKMGRALTAAMMGCRNFIYAGTLCVDDVYSGTQFVIDLEIVEYIRELIESLNPHPDIIATEGLYEELRDVCLGNDIFLAHPNTVERFRNILPSSKLIVREKLRSWMEHHKTLKDRTREIAIDKIRSFEPKFVLADDKLKALEAIYDRAKKKLC